MYDKKIVPGCLAIIVKGAAAGKTVRCESRHESGDIVSLPNGRNAAYKPVDKSNVVAWLCVGSVTANGEGGVPLRDGKGFCMTPEHALMRIDHDDDSTLREEFSIEEASYAMEEQIKREGGKRLW